MSIRSSCGIFSKLMLMLAAVAAFSVSGCDSSNTGAIKNGDTAPKISVSLQPSDGQIVNPGDGLDLTASVTNDASNAGVTWAIVPADGGGELTDVTPTSAKFRAPTSVANSTNVTVTATSAADKARFTTLTINIQAPPIAASAAPASSIPGAASLAPGSQSNGRIVRVPQANQRQ